MNWLIGWGVKKWLVGVANTAIAKYSDNITVARGYVGAVIEKAEAVLSFLKSLDQKLADGRLTEDEADGIVDEAAYLGKQLVK